VCSLETAQATQADLINGLLQPSGIKDETLGLLPPDGCNQVYAVVFGTVEDRSNTGVPVLRDWFCNVNTGGKIPIRNLRYHLYTPVGFAAAMDPEGYAGMRGKSLIRWTSPSTGLGVLSVYLSSDQPVLEVTFDGDWDTFGNPSLGFTQATTDGAGNRVFS
jgi:hypothetical protein